MISKNYYCRDVCCSHTTARLSYLRLLGAGSGFHAPGPLAGTHHVLTRKRCRERQLLISRRLPFSHKPSHLPSIPLNSHSDGGSRRHAAAAYHTPVIELHD